MSDTNFMQTVDMTDEEQLEMYLNTPPEEVAKMLIQCNKIIKGWIIEDDGFVRWKNN